MPRSTEGERIVSEVAKNEEKKRKDSQSQVASAEVFNVFTRVLEFLSRMQFHDRY